MINEIVFGNYYNIRLIDKWSSLVYNCLIIGETKPKGSIEINEDFNFNETFFTPFGIGLENYFRIINDDANILIVKIAKTLTPEIVLEESTFYIPYSLIDFNNSSKLFPIYTYEITAGSTFRYFIDTEEQKLFEDNGKKELNKVLKNTDFFSSETDLGIILNKTKSYITEEEILEDNVKREAATSNRKKIIIDTRLSNERREANIYNKELEMNQKIAAADASKLNYDEKSSYFIDLSNELENAITTTNKTLENIYQYAYLPLKQYSEDNSGAPPLPPWEDFLNDIMNNN